MAKSSAKLLIAAVVGVAAGIGIGMLIAPSKGSKTRKRLKKKIMGFADLMQDDLSEKVNAFKSAFSSEEGMDDPYEPEIVPEQEAK
jgi:gas vesicle protein